MSTRPGKVRVARLTDLAALGELSRRSGSGEEGTRSLGLPVSGPPIGVFALFRLRLGAFGPHDLLYVYEDDGRISGFLRVERDTARDEWTIVELDAIGAGTAGDIRFRLVQQLLRDGPRRGAIRFHVACRDGAGNVELFMQHGFVRYGEERVFFRPPELPLSPPADAAPGDEASGPIRPASPLDALALARLYAAVTPPPVQRLEAYRLHDWERLGVGWRVPRSSLAPILRFATVESFVLEGTPGSGGNGRAGARGVEGDATVDAFVQVGVAEEDQPHYLRVIARPGVDAAPVIRFGLSAIAARLGTSPRHDHGVISPVRTYESPTDNRLEDAGFAPVASVTLLMKETLVRVAEPALVPATR